MSAAAGAYYGAPVDPETAALMRSSDTIDTDKIRRSVEAMYDKINYVFRDLGIEAAIVLRNEMVFGRDMMKNKNLPYLMGVTTQEEALTKLNVNMGLEDQQTEKSLAAFVMAETFPFDSRCFMTCGRSFRFASDRS